MNERDLFLSALEIEDPAARKAHLQSACADNGELLTRVESLLASHEGESRFLQTPVVEQLEDNRTGEIAATIVMGTGSTQDEEPSGDDSATSILDFSQLQERVKMSDEIPLGYLEPSTKPGSLGRLAHYEILEVVGQGAFGTVLRAFDEKLQRVVAIKVMAPELAATSPARKRFVREAQASAAIRHEHVVSVYSVEEKPIPYLVMEYIPGVTLQHRLDEKGPLDVPTVLRLGTQIAEGLAAAHAKDLIHRDIKPGNILLEAGMRDRVKITDFGLARAADDASMTQSGTIAGTPMYMAPEQALGHKLDQRADLFSFGSVLYQMASGRPPFRASSTLAVLKRLTEDTPRPIREIIPEAPTWLCDIITKLHAKNPDERYQSAREIADVLANCESQLKAHAGLKDFSLIPRGKAQPAGWWKWVAVAALVLPLLAIGLYAVTRPGSQPKVAGNGSSEPSTPDPIKPVAEPTPVSVAKQEPLPPTFKNGIGMEFVVVPKGKSWLGGGKDKPGDKEVEIPADFYLGQYEVTQEEWEKVMGENPSYFSRKASGNPAVITGIADAELKRFPVEMVSWDQIQLFVAKLNKLEKETGWVYRLPTEAEWEYACRGGPMSDKLDSAFDYYLAKPTNTLLPVQANFDSGLERTCKVGSYAPNKLGFFDMHGNVTELCEDIVKVADQRPRGVHRGGGWDWSADICRTKLTWTHSTSGRSSNIGFRLAQVPSGVPSSEAKTPPLAVAPFTDAYVQRIAALPAAGQVEAVRKELRRLNPKFDGKLKHKIEGDVVTELSVNTDEVLNIAPVRALAGLIYFDCRGTYPNKGKLSDLSPLKGMTIRRLDCSSTQVADLTPLTGLPLTWLHFNHNPVFDISPLKGMPLDNLGCADTRMSDLSPLKGMKLKSLGAQNLWMTDLSPLEGMPLTVLDLYHTGVTDLKPLRGMPLVVLNLHDVPVSDLSPLKGMTTLRTLALAGSEVSDLTPLAGLKLTTLILRDKLVTDLSPLKGMPLVRLEFYGTGVTDLRPLQGMSTLQTLLLTPQNITHGIEILRDMQSLKTIGIGSAANQAWPAAEFWARYDKGEFKE